MSRPIIYLPLSTFEKCINGLAFFVLVCTIIFAIYSYFVLPSIIPIHFNAKGIADNYGKKETLFFLPVLAAVLYIFLSYLGKHPEWYNYPVKITEQNAATQYHNARGMMRMLKLSIMMIFLLIVIASYFAGSGKVTKLPGFLLPLIIVLAISPTIFYIVRSFKKSRA